MKREELIKFLDWYDELPWQIQLISHEDTADKYLSTLPDEKEEDEINPYLLTGEELERAVEKRKSNQP